MIVEHAPPPRLSLIAQTAFLDLARLLKDDAVSDIRGAPTRVVRGARAYWYDSYRIGAEVRKSYLGEDSEELRARLARAGELAAEREESRRHRARLIRILRAEGVLGLDAGVGSLLAALQKAGVFRLGGVLVGTQAFRLYEGELGLRYAFDQTAQTSDIDIVGFERLSLALDDIVSPPLQAVLRDFSFDPVPSLEPGKVWRWRQTRSDLMVEFLTPSFDGGEDLRPLAALSVHAQALRYLNYLIADPIETVAVWRNGVLVRVPRPERFAVHKLIVADRRRGRPDALRALKDRAQADFLIEALARDRPEDLREAWQDASSRGPRWRGRLAATLTLMPQARARLAQCGVTLPP